MKIYQLLFYLVGIGILFPQPICAQWTQIPMNTEHTVNAIICKHGQCIISDNYNKIFIYDIGTDSIIERELSVIEPKGFKFDLHVTDSMKLYALHDLGPNYTHFQVILSEDTGKTWIAHEPHRGWPQSFAMATDSIFMVAGPLGYLRRSFDGGKNWEDISLPSQVHFYLVEFLTPHVGNVVNNYSVGQTWDYGDNFMGYSIFTFHTPRDLFFLDSLTHFISSFDPQDGSSHIHKSVDGGKTWGEKFNSRGFIYEIRFVSDSVGYAVGSNDRPIGRKGHLFKTTDKGETWEEIKTPLTTIFTSIDFINDSIALVGGSHGMLIEWNTRAPITTHLADDLLAESIQIYPNPAADRISVELDLPSTKSIELSLLDLQGRTVKQIDKQRLGANTSLVEIPIDELEIGCYVMRIAVDEDVVFRKWCKIK